MGQMINKNCYSCFLILLVCFFLSGCASTLRKASTFDTRIRNVKTIAIMPADIEVYKVTAGGLTELMDEWSETANELMERALKEELSGKYGFNIVPIGKDWLKANHKELWETNRALYNAVGISALRHAYPGIEAFSDKIENFDYTLGPDVHELAQICGADALLFVVGVDHEETAGKVALNILNMMVGAAFGVTVIPMPLPSFMTLGLVDGESGYIEWFNITPADVQYSFRSEKHIKAIVQWLVRDFLPKE